MARLARQSVGLRDSGELFAVRVFVADRAPQVVEPKNGVRVGPASFWNVASRA